MKTFLLAFLVACGFPEPAPHSDGGIETGPHRLLAIEPAIANAGETVTLEGTFGDDAAVTFPGGTTVRATIAGPHRATVVVPESAGTGDLTVAIDGATAGTAAFRRPSFTLGLSTFFARDDQAFGPRQTAALTTPRTFHASTLTPRFLYVLGGFAAGGAVIGGIERMRVDADGSLGRGEASGALAVPRARARAIAIAGHVYVVGGVTAGGAPVDSIERALLLADGTLGPFEVLPARLGHPRVSAAVAVIGDHLVVTGGGHASTERARIGEDGPGAFEELPGVAPATGTGAVVGDYFYVVGEKVARAAIAADGTVQPFEAAGGLAAPRVDPLVAVIGRSLYVLGGTDPASGARLASVEVATIAADGSLGAFAPAANATLPVPVAGASLDIVGNAVRLVVGGAVLHASLVGSTQLGAPAVVPGVELATPRHLHAIAIRGDKLYLVAGIGGASNGKTIDIATVGPDGSITGVAVAASQLITSRFGATAVVLGDFLYVLGGVGGSGALASVERAAIAPDGSLGPFTDAAAMVRGHHFASAVVIDDFLYVVAGATGASTIIPFVERAPIAADGTLGTFEDVAPLQTQRFNHSLVVLGDRLFVLGGVSQNGVAPGIASVEQATIRPDGSLAAFTAAPSLVIGRGAQTSMVIGATLFQLLGSGIGTAPATDLETATVNGDGTLAAFARGAAFANPKASTPIGVLGDHVYWLGTVDEDLTTHPTITRAELR